MADNPNFAFSQNYPPGYNVLPSANPGTPMQNKPYMYPCPGTNAFPNPTVNSVANSANLGLQNMPHPFANTSLPVSQAHHAGLGNFNVFPGQNSDYISLSQSTPSQIQSLGNPYGVPTNIQLNAPPLIGGPRGQVSQIYPSVRNTSSIAPQNTIVGPPSNNSYGGTFVPSNTPYSLPPRTNSFFGSNPANGQLLNNMQPKNTMPMPTSQHFPPMSEHPNVGAGFYGKTGQPRMMNPQPLTGVSHSLVRGSTPQVKGGFSANPTVRSNFRGGYNRFVERDPNESSQEAIRADTVYITKIPKDIDHEIIKSQFGKIGKIKDNRKTGMPMIWIFKEGGIPRGDALVTFENNNSAEAAVKHFLYNDFNGTRINVRLATNSERPKIVPPGNDSGGRTHPPSDFTTRFPNPSRGNSLMANRGSRGAPGRGGASSSEGEWRCLDCNNSNYTWRSNCNRCQSSRPIGDPHAGRGSKLNGNFGGPMRGQSSYRGSRPTPY